MVIWDFNTMMIRNGDRLQGATFKTIWVYTMFPHLTTSSPQGCSLPCIFPLMIKWFPPFERSRFIAYILFCELCYPWEFLFSSVKVRRNKEKQTIKLWKNVRIYIHTVLILQATTSALHWLFPCVVWWSMPWVGPLPSTWLGLCHFSGVSCGFSSCTTPLKSTQGNHFPSDFL